MLVLGVWSLLTVGDDLLRLLTSRQQSLTPGLHKHSGALGEEPVRWVSAACNAASCFLT